MTEGFNRPRPASTGLRGSRPAYRPAARHKRFRERLTQRLSTVRNSLAVMGGKGGVGKSTVAVNLAAALAVKGRRVGVLDGDIHGPNVPEMFGLRGLRPRAGSDGLCPLVAQEHIRVMSIAFLLGCEDAPMAWRGALKHSLLEQFLADVDWGDLDYLVIDLPPGTGDEPLSLAQLLAKPLWAVVVTTPQDLAIMDSRRAVVFARAVEMTVLGIIENMSGLVCPHCQGRVELFTPGGAKRASREMGVPFLGRVPFDPCVGKGGDAGVPVVLTNPESEVSKAFRKMASRIDKALCEHAAAPW